MQVLLGIALIVAGCSLIVAGVAVLCWHDYDDEPVITATGWGFQHYNDTLTDPEGYDE